MSGSTPPGPPPPGPPPPGPPPRADGPIRPGPPPPPDDGATAPPPTVLQTFLEVAGDRVVPTTMPKATLATLCRAVEDLVLHEDLAGAVLTAFQDVSNLQAESDRYEQLAASDDRVVAAFARGDIGAGDRVRRFRLADDHPLTREWLLLVLTDRFSAAVFGRRLVDPAGPGAGDPPFLAVWSFDPTVVADVCTTLGAAAASISPAAHRTVTAAVAAHPPCVPAAGVSQRVVNTVLERLDAKRRRWRDRALDAERELAAARSGSAARAPGAGAVAAGAAAGARAGAGGEDPTGSGHEPEGAHRVASTDDPGYSAADRAVALGGLGEGGTSPAEGGAVDGPGGTGRADPSGDPGAGAERAVATDVPAGGAASEAPNGPAADGAGPRATHAGSEAAGTSELISTGDATELRALVVDDDAAIRGLVEALLRRAGWDVTAVADRREAVRSATSATYDVLLLDVNLADDDGPELLWALEREAPGTRTRAGFMTGSPPADGVIDGRPVLTKPFGWSDLEALLLRLLET